MLQWQRSGHTKSRHPADQALEQLNLCCLLPPEQAAKVTRVLNGGGTEGKDGGVMENILRGAFAFAGDMWAIGTILHFLLHAHLTLTRNTTFSAEDALQGVGPSFGNSCSSYCVDISNFAFLILQALFFRHQHFGVSQILRSLTNDFLSFPASIRF